MNMKHVKNHSIRRMYKFHLRQNNESGRENEMQANNKLTTV